MNTLKFELKQDGSVERVGPFGSYGPTVDAKNKSEAVTKFLSLAWRCIEQPPTVKIRNGAYQLAYESMIGVSVESGYEGRESSICYSGESSRRDVTDKSASFDYYASAEFRDAQRPAA